MNELCVLVALIANLSNKGFYRGGRVAFNTDNATSHFSYESKLTRNKITLNLFNKTIKQTIKKTTNLSHNKDRTKQFLSDKDHKLRYSQHFIVTSDNIFTFIKPAKQT